MIQHPFEKKPTYKTSDLFRETANPELVKQFREMYMQTPTHESTIINQTQLSTRCVLFILYNLADMLQERACGIQNAVPLRAYILYREKEYIVIARVCSCGACGAMTYYVYTYERGIQAKELDLSSNAIRLEITENGRTQQIDYSQPERSK